MATKHESFAAAIAAAQANMNNAIKGSVNPHFKSRYADLAAVRDVVLPALNAEGVAVLQSIDGEDDVITVSTTLLWGAERIEAGRCSISISGERNRAQGAGKVASYLRRYQLASLGIAQEDDDGQSIAETPRRQQPTKAQSTAQQQLAKVEQILHREVGCNSKEDADTVIRWVTGGCWSLATWKQDPGDVLGALQERNDSNPPYEFMLSAAIEEGRKEAKQ
tara:strand:+ start:422 stop:1084 length:663 start_codon:yes stop_codon:yes gene_type:complete